MKPSRLILIAVVKASFAACGAERVPVDEQRCSELRRHLVELQLNDVHIATGVNIEAHREALNAALGDDFVPSCLSKLDEVQVTCLLSALDQEAAQACVPKSTEASRPTPARKE